MWAGEAAIEGRLQDNGKPSELVEDALRFGIDPALLDEADTQDGIWPENLPAVLAFLAINTQWRAIALADGRSHFIGLDYSAAAAGLGFAGLTVTPALWADVQAVEAGALTALNRNRM
jgi:hypothetical protein